jgi:hypothetical protein
MKKECQSLHLSVIHFMFNVTVFLNGFLHSIPP